MAAVAVTIPFPILHLLLFPKGILIVAIMIIKPTEEKLREEWDLDGKNSAKSCFGVQCLLPSFTTTGSLPFDVD
jgi:hypothetical protein